MSSVFEKPTTFLRKRTMRMGMDGAEAVEIWRMAGSDEQQLMTELFGYAPVKWLGFMINWRREHPLYNWLIVDNCSIAPTDPDNPPAGSESYYPTVDATITYKGGFIVNNIPVIPRPGDPTIPNNNGTLTYNVEASAEMLTIPSHGFQWSENERQGQGRPTRCEPWHRGADAPSQLHLAQRL